MKKKVLLLFVAAAACAAILAGCAGAPIVYHEDYDMTRGVVDCEPKEIEFTAASYNIKGGTLTETRAEAIRNLLSDAEVDVAGLQEMDQLSKRSGETDFMRVFTKAPFEFGYFAPTETALMGETYGIAALSRAEFDETAAFLLPYPYERENPNVEKRVVIRTLCRIDGVQIAFYNTHLSFEDITLRDGRTLRRAQAEYIADLMQSDPVPYKILTGDFNIESFEKYAPFFRKGFSAVNTADAPFESFREDAPFRAIDNLFYSANLELLSVTMPDSDLSDHNPLIARFRTLL